MLTIKNLNVFTKSNTQILKDISFDIEDEKTLCILGQSGSGKSVLAYSIMDVLHKNLQIKDGFIKLDDIILSELKPFDRRRKLGILISLVMQNPLTALDPTVKIGKQIEEAIKIHDKKIKKTDLKNKIISLLENVKLDESIFNKYPHEISGGMAQKVVIAIAIANNPKLIIADEPITALDKKNTHTILKLLKEIKEKSNSSMIYISHDIESIEYMADDILVLYKGQIVEILSKDEFVKNPLHPYTIDLKNSVIKGNYKTNKTETIPDIDNYDGTGCRYLSKCKHKTDECKKDIPITEKNNHLVRCINIKE